MFALGIFAAANSSGFGGIIFTVAVTAVLIPLILAAVRLDRKKFLKNVADLAGRHGWPVPAFESLGKETAEVLRISAGRKTTGGFPARAPGMLLSGKIGGNTVYFWKFITGSGKHTAYWCAVSVQSGDPTPLTASFQPQGFGTKLSELFGAKEIVVGDPEFDKAWFVQTNQPDYLAAALLPEIRAKFMDFRRAKSAGTFAIGNGLSHYETTGSFSDAKAIARLEQQLPLLADLAAVAAVASNS